MALDRESSVESASPFPGNDGQERRLTHVIGSDSRLQRAGSGEVGSEQPAEWLWNTLSLSDYIWGSNGVAGNQSLQLIVTHRLQKNYEFRQAAAENLHYLIGRNCFDLSWVTQLGPKAFQHPHHRPSAAGNIAAPWPGLLSGGPMPIPPTGSAGCCRSARRC